jgi:nitrogen fixation protein NifT
MVRRNESGKLLFYVAKKDLEEVIAAVERDTPEEWGGKITLSDGETFFIDPIRPPPVFPTTLRFKRVE